MSKKTPAASVNDLPYRPCVGVVLLNDENKVWVGQRNDLPETNRHAWQMPQGGIDKGEDPKDAALRELKEETGIQNADIIAELDGWLRYDLPPELLGKVWKGKYRGQKQKWFVLRFTGADSEVNINTKHPEFTTWRWADPADVPNEIVPFKKEIYQHVMAQVARLLKT